MKKKDLINILINLVVIIAITLMIVLTNNLDEKISKILEYLLCFSIVCMYLLVSKLTYDRIKKYDKSKKTFNILTLLYALVSLTYIVFNIYVNNIVLVFISLGLFLSVLFVYLVYYSAEVYKRIENKDKIGIIKILIVLLTLIILCLISSLISKNINFNILFSVSLYLVFVSSLIFLTLMIVIYVAKKLLFIK